MTVTLDDVLAAVADAQRDMQADPSLVPHLYVDQKWPIAQIAQHTGLHRSTVYRRLEASGDYRGPGQPGAPRKERCIRDHSLAEWGVLRKGGGRSCRRCKQIRERKT